MENKQPIKWYFKTSSFIIALLCIGPLALPLAWFNPRFGWKTKLAISAVVLIATYYLAILFATSLRGIEEYYRELLQAR